MTDGVADVRLVSGITSVTSRRLIGNFMEDGPPTGHKGTVKVGVVCVLYIYDRRAEESGGKSQRGVTM